MSETSSQNTTLSNRNETERNIKFNKFNLSLLESQSVWSQCGNSSVYWSWSQLRSDGYGRWPRWHRCQWAENLADWDSNPVPSSGVDRWLAYNLYPRLYILDHGAPFLRREYKHNGAATHISFPIYAELRRRRCIEMCSRLSEIRHSVVRGKTPIPLTGTVWVWCILESRPCYTKMLVVDWPWYL